MSRASLSWSKHVLPLGAVVAGLCVLAGVVAWHLAGLPPSPTRPVALADLIDELAAGHPGAVEAAKRAAAAEGPAAGPALAAMLHHAEPRVRAAACAILAGSPGEPWIAAVLPRASDTDWRVRMAAFEALSTARRLAEEPLRDTPLEERETVLLNWLDAHDAAAAAPLGPDLCELYAGDAAVEFGRPLAARCLACHAGTPPAPLAASEACGRCHAAIYEEWSGSAHAQSLSHLHLAGVNPETRQPEQMSFGEVRGMGCRECHRPVAEPSGPLPRDRAGLTQCPVKFRPDARAADSCARCHASTVEEWQHWLKGPQPRAAPWPPGEVQADHRGDTRTCIDCHMPGRPAGGDKAEHGHTWAARRDAERLRGGVAVRTQVAAGSDAAAGPEVRVKLINLAGHAYPTGTRRRALRLLAGPPGGQMKVVATLSPDRPAGAITRRDPALAPGEQRDFVVPAAPEAQAVRIRLEYCRDAGDPAAAVTDLFTAEEDLRPWIGPQVGPAGPAAPAPGG